MSNEHHHASSPSPSPALDSDNDDTLGIPEAETRTKHPRIRHPQRGRVVE